MASLRRAIRKVLDARIDLGQTERPFESSIIGWSSAVPIYYNPFGNFGTQAQNNQAFDEYAHLRGGFGTQPHGDGVVVSGGPGTGQPKQCRFDPFTAPAEVGLKHYHQQMQAMKSTSWPASSTMAAENHFGIHPNSNNPQGPASSSNHNFPNQGVQGIQGLGNGTSPDFRNHNISMGNMRGFEYHNSSDDVWPSSIGLPGGGNPVVEALHNIGQIQVGGIVTGGGTGA